MFNRILIANRGEIACRIIKTAKLLGVHCIAVYSQADANAQHVKMADEAYLLGPAQSSESYLRSDKILQIAIDSGAQAVHPGYGFLSENAQFAEACEKNNIVFIGPPASAIAAMGSKSAAKEIMSKADVPLVPGYHGDNQDPQLLKQQAEICGFPLLLKAVAGGGGKGMRVVESLDEFDAALSAAQREAMNSFSNSDMLIERYLPKTRHIEVQVFCDTQGNGVYLSQRDCSIQRRHQKIVEEAPAPGIKASVVEAMGVAALNAAKAINYVGAGTVEFLYNPDQSFYFMEMNTRLQVEHPVTEMITNVDLVKWQLQIASGEPLPLTQDQVQVNGHALECRIYAEDPNNEFLPATGTLEYLRTPAQNDSLRVDTGVVEGDEVSVYYDPMISKLIVWGEDREQAILKMRSALQDYRIVGIKNNIPFLHKVITSKAFSDDEIDTQFIDKNKSVLFNTDYCENEFLAIASCAQIIKQAQIANESTQTTALNNAFQSGVSQWRLNQAPKREMLWLSKHDDAQNHIVSVFEQAKSLANKPSATQPTYRFKVEIGSDQYMVDASLLNDDLTATLERVNSDDVASKQFKLHAHFNKQQVNLFYQGLSLEFKQPDLAHDGDDSHAEGTLSAPMNGRVIAVLVKEGDTVSCGDPLIIIEAMKMEHTIVALEDGSIDDVYFVESDLVSEGDTLIAMSNPEGSKDSEDAA